VRARFLAVPLLLVAITPPAIAQRGTPTLHEPIPPDPREDVALSISLEGDLPAAINTPRGLVAAPDPARPFGTGEAPYSPMPKAESPGATFRPDRDTRRPDVLPYDDPFSPSTAPFKRLSAYDTVDANYTLSVRDPHTAPMGVSPTPPPDSSEEHFYADMVIDLAAGRKVRIPSVGPGARVLRARAGVGTQDVKFTLHKDGADNWFIDGEATTRARLVMELSIPRAAFGGDFGNPTRAQLAKVPQLPPNVVSAARQVSQKIGVTPETSPREVVSKLVTYFRSFQDSEDPPSGRGDIYLDLALQQKGVCRHRAFAFLVTSLYLGIPTRMISNEAHAWVEVDDGRLWRRIDLGGAGRTLHDPLSTNVPYEAPHDPWNWPQGSTRGEELADRARRASGSPTPATSGSAATATGSAALLDPHAPPMSGGTSGTSSNQSSGGAMTASSTNLRPVTLPGPDDRPVSQLTMTLSGSDARRGAALPVKGQVTADGEPCGHVAVEIVLKSARQGEIPVGVLATDERGNYDGALVVPSNVPLGDYEAHARTLGDVRCGKGQN
jgi:hypothetical protein